jgi:Domain of unknown function (DUF4249)
MSRLFLYISILFVAASCREQFEAPGSSPETGYLVVEGLINSGTGPTTFRLSRTLPLADSSRTKPERFAVVSVEGDNNTATVLPETGEGVYTIGQLNLLDNVKYRLNIHTNNGREYITEYAAARKSPPIDNIAWERTGEGVQLYINTHDPQDTTRYYRWEYEETWEFHSNYYTTIHYVLGPDGVAYDVDYSSSAQSEAKFKCWRSLSSSNILIGNSVKLSRDTIHLPLLSVPQDSWKMSVLYSVNVKQYSPSPRGYEFLQRMKRITENLGTLFDAQPSQLETNIRCVQDPAEAVIGHVDVAQVQQKRIFIKRGEVAPWNYRQQCEEISLVNNPDSVREWQYFMIPTTVDKASFTGRVLRYFASIPNCVDCTTMGSNIKPSFWP